MARHREIAYPANEDLQNEKPTPTKALSMMSSVHPPDIISDFLIHDFSPQGWPANTTAAVLKRLNRLREQYKYKGRIWISVTGVNCNPASLPLMLDKDSPLFKEISAQTVGIIYLEEAPTLTRHWDVMMEYQSAALRSWENDLRQRVNDILGIERSIGETARQFLTTARMGETSTRVNDALLKGVHLLFPQDEVIRDIRQFFENVKRSQNGVVAAGDWNKIYLSLPVLRPCAPICDTIARIVGLATRSLEIGIPFEYNGTIVYPSEINSLRSRPATDVLSSDSKQTRSIALLIDLIHSPEPPDSPPEPPESSEGKRRPTTHLVDGVNGVHNGRAKPSKSTTQGLVEGFAEVNQQKGVNDADVPVKEKSFQVRWLTRKGREVQDKPCTEKGLNIILKKNDFDFVVKVEEHYFAVKRNEELEPVESVSKIQGTMLKLAFENHDGTVDLEEDICKNAVNPLDGKEIKKPAAYQYPRSLREPLGDELYERFIRNNGDGTYSINPDWRDNEKRVTWCLVCESQDLSKLSSGWRKPREKK